MAIALIAHVACLMYLRARLLRLSAPDLLSDTLPDAPMVVSSS